VKWIDRTTETATVLRTRDGRNIYSHGNPRARRSVSAIDAVILHQTTFVSAEVGRFDYVIANYVVMQDGTVLKLRDPASALNSVGTDQRAIDIEFVGNYPTAGSVPPSAQILAGRELVDQLRARHHVGRIFAHAHFRAKNCPGPRLWYNVGEWFLGRGLVADRAVRAVPRDWTDGSLAIPGLPGSA
jgi:N-acetylmuramoyl-L-alanine amidase-like protein